MEFKARGFEFLALPFMICMTLSMPFILSHMFKGCVNKEVYLNRPDKP